MNDKLPKPRFSVFSNILDGSRTVLDDGKHFQTVATITGAHDLAGILTDVAALAGRDGAISRDPDYQREIIAHAIAKSLGFRVEKRSDES